MRKIVIAPYQIHKNLLALYRGKDLFSDVKIMTKEELLGQYYGKLSKGVVPYIIKKFHLKYDNVLSIIPFLPYIEKEEKDLFVIKSSLIEDGLLKKNNYLKQFFKNNDVSIYGYSKYDEELLYVLNQLSIPYKINKYEDKKIKRTISYFETQFEEVLYTLNKIAHLLDEGKDINNIYIYRTNKEYDYYLRKFSSDFGFEVDVDKTYSLYSTSTSYSFLKNYLANKDFSLSLESVKENGNEDVIKIIESSYDQEMSFEEQFDYVSGELKSTRSSKKVYKDIVQIIDRPIFEKDAHIFILGFAQGFFPNSHKDNQLLSDVKKEKYHLNTSLINNKIDDELILDFLNSDNNIYFSFAERSISNKYFLSPYVQKLDIEKVEEQLPEVIYSQNMINYLFAKAKDIKDTYLETTNELLSLDSLADISYGSYDNSFSGVDALDNKMKMSYSYSSINSYYKCPFMYYLSNILKVDPFEGNFYSKFGSVAHKIFELHNNEDFDFDKEYQKAIDEEGFLPEELPILENLKFQIQRASEAIKLHQKYMVKPSIITEYKTRFEFAKNSFVSGIIDKAIILDDKYLVIVDYKTGRDSFSPEYIQEGVSLQLPTYCLLTMTDGYLKQFQIIGAFINNVIDTKLHYEPLKDAYIDSCYRLNGKIVEDIELISYLDQTILNGKSEFIKGVKLLKAGGLQKSATNSTLVDEQEFKYYAEVAYRKFLEADKNIRENNFSINPLYIDANKNACSECQYKDICFVRHYQRRIINKDLIEESEEDDDE